jgi:Glycosyl hydrolase family 26
MERDLIARSLALAAAFLLGLLALATSAVARSGGNGQPADRRVRIGLSNARELGSKSDACARRESRRRIDRRQRERQGSCGADVPAAPLYWGATIGPQLTGTQAPWDMTAVAKFEEHAQKPVSLIQFFQPFSNCASTPCSFYRFPTAPLENVRQHGAIPVLAWASESIPASVAEPDFQLSDLIEGRFDASIREFATAAKAWGHPFFLRFNWEMNGNWFPWSESANGNRPGEYVAAWRHVHDIFTAVGATNATWAWCPYVDPANTLQGLGSLYPGDEYVDWTCLDGYNWGTNPARPAGWRTFDQLYSSTYREVTGSIAPSKPMLIGEVGSSEYGGSKPAWIADALARIPVAYPQIRGLLWFDTLADNMDWPIETSTAATAAFAAGIQGPEYVGNNFSSAGDTVVQPPG